MLAKLKVYGFVRALCFILHDISQCGVLLLLPANPCNCKMRYLTKVAWLG
jgi:hypothetical protein